MDPQNLDPQYLEHLPLELLLLIMEDLPPNILLVLRQSLHPAIQQAANIQLMRANGLINHFEVQGLTGLFTLNRAIDARAGVQQLINTITSITFTSVRSRNSRNSNNIIAAIGNVMLIPELQHIHFQENTDLRLVPIVANPSLTIITMDIPRATTEYWVRYLHLCLVNSGSLQELHLNRLPGAAIDQVFGGEGMLEFPGPVLHFPEEFPNLRRMVLRFRATIANRVVPPVILPVILDNLPQLVYLDIQNLGRLNRAEERAAFMVLPQEQQPNVYPNLQTLRIQTRDISDNFLDFIQLQLPGLQRLIMQGAYGFRAFRNSVERLSPRWSLK
ncbi:hypothetical protein MBANPS3_012583, partial [Mucor bainieri]